MPSEVLRDRSEGRQDKKRRRRRSGRCGRKKKILFQDLAGLVDANSSDDSGSDSGVAAKCRKPVTNVCAGLEELIVKAAQVQKDFPKDVKIEMPRFRCLLCHKNFPLAGYRKVCVCTVAILINLCKRKPRDCKKNPNSKHSMCARSVISNCIWKRISGSKRVR